MITRKPWMQHLLALVLPVTAIFGYNCWYWSYLYGHSKAVYLAYYAARWDRGFDVHLLWRLMYSAALYAVVIIGLYELVLLALKGRFEGED